MSTTENLKQIKTVLATCFLTATEKCLADGLQFKYTSYPMKDNENAWAVDIIVKEAGYSERTIQQFKYLRPDNIDAKNMEYHVIVEVISNLTQGCLISWYELAKYLNKDKDLQKEIIHGTKNSFTGNKQ